MSDIITGIIVSALASSALTALVTGLLRRRKTGAEAGKIEVEAGVVIFNTLKDLIAPMRAEITRLSVAHAECEQKNLELKFRVDEQGNELRRLEHELIERTPSQPGMKP